eukprot:4358737-Amphidinium_carterae.1
MRLAVGMNGSRVALISKMKWQGGVLDVESPSCQQTTMSSCMEPLAEYIPLRCSAGSSQKGCLQCLSRVQPV